MNENDEKKYKWANISEIFCQDTPLFSAKEIHNRNHNVNNKIVKYINNALIELKKDVNWKKFLKMKIQIKYLTLLETAWILINNKKVKDFLWT